MTHRLRVDPIACTAHGACAELLPELVALDDWGYPMTATGPVPPELLAHARRAAACCPTLALRLAAAPPDALSAPGRSWHAQPSASGEGKAQLEARRDGAREDELPTVTTRQSASQVEADARAAGTRGAAGEDVTRP